MINQNYEIIKNKIDNACKKAGRNSEEIRLIAVTKTISPERISETYSLGIKDFGENKVQELISKVEKTPRSINWHFIGHLQRNKVKYLKNFIHLIHSVDSLTLAEEINKCAQEAKRFIPILIQVNTSNEESKYGIKPESVVEFVKQVIKLPDIKIMGLMTIGALVEDPELARPCFRLLKEIREDISAMNMENVEMKHLSMGMTSDFEIAIEEGATIIRIGTALFGARN
jgi:pyridoxal phosphate enzyme (YggS family)